MLKRLSALPLLAAVMLIEPLHALAQQAQQPSQPPQGYWPGPWHMWSDGYGWRFWWIWPVMMMLFMLLMCGAMFFLGHRSSGGGTDRSGPPWRMGAGSWGDSSHSALQILNERFARGEIQKSEYEDKKAAILSGGRH